MTASFSAVLADHAARYPAMEPRDFAKLAYQSVFGPEHLLRDTAQQGVIRRDIGLTFAGVDEDGVHPSGGADGFDIGGEGGAAHAHDAGLPDDGEQVIRGEPLQGLAGEKGMAGRILTVILQDRREDRPAGGMGTGLQSQDPAGNRGVDCGAQPLGVPDLLPQAHRIAGLYQGSAGPADMLKHGDDHLRGGGRGSKGGAAGELLAALWMDAAPEQMSHRFTSLSGSELP